LRLPGCEEKQPGGAAMREGFESRGGSGRIGRVQPCALPWPAIGKLRDYTFDDVKGLLC